jgi:tetratricopeptide (TPR) repeat protein
MIQIKPAASSGDALDVFTVTTFSTFASLLLAAQKLAADPDPLNRVKALADLASNGKALAAALRDSGLGPLAQEMAARAGDADRAYAHDGWAEDDARAIFWQVAPAALADPAAMVAGDLDAASVTDRLVAAVRASEHGHDFGRTAMAEAYFRAVAEPTLAVMLARADFVATITPDLWRGVLRRHGVQIELLERLDGKIDAQSARLARMEALLLERLGPAPPAVAEATIIELARRVAPRTEDIEEALGELRRAVDIAADMQARGQAGSNVDAFVDGVLRRLAELTREGRLDEAAAAADQAVDRAEAGLIQLIDAAVDQHLLALDAEGAARQVARRLMLAAPDPAALFNALRAEQDIWYERGRDKGLRLDLEVAVALARHTRRLAGDADERGAALDDLGNALWALGQRQGGREPLEEAVAIFHAALAEHTRERVPLDWATTQNNLGNALVALGEQEGGTERMEEAVAAYRAALTECTRERAPLDWAMTQNNLGAALQKLGEREGGTARLEEAAAAYRAALGEWDRERVPLRWATTHINLGAALRALGEHDDGTARLEEAVAAYRDALTECTRERVPLDWATVQVNLGNVLQALEARAAVTGGLEAAVAAYRAALAEATRERAPLLWAATQAGLGNALFALGERGGGTDLLEQAVAAYRAALGEYTRERAPLQWATVQNSLGGALFGLGERQSGTARLEEAIAAFGAALEERTRARVPIQWAITTGSQGFALLDLAERTSDAGLARRARDQIAAATAALGEDGHVPLAEVYASELPAAEALVARLAGIADDRPR